MAYSTLDPKDKDKGDVNSYEYGADEPVTVETDDPTVAGFFANTPGFEVEQKGPYGESLHEDGQNPIEPQTRDINSAIFSANAAASGQTAELAQRGGASVNRGSDAPAARQEKTEKEGERVWQAAASMVIMQQVTASLSEGLRREVDLAVRDHMIGANDASARLSSAKAQISALETQFPMSVLLQEELTEAQQAKYDEMSQMQTEAAQTEYLELPSQIDAALVDASKAIQQTEGIDPEVAENAMRGVYTSEARDLLNGTLAPEQASPYSVQIAQSVAENFVGDPEMLAQAAIRSPAAPDVVVQSDFDIYTQRGLISPIAQGYGNGFDAINVSRIDPDMGSAASVAVMVDDARAIEGQPAMLAANDAGITSTVAYDSALAGQALVPSSSELNPSDPAIQNRYSNPTMTTGDPLFDRLSQGPKTPDDMMAFSG